MLDEITKAVDGIDQAKVLEFLRAKKKEVGDAVDLWTLPEAPSGRFTTSFRS